MAAGLIDEYLLMVRPYASPRPVGTVTAITDVVVSRTLHQLRPRGTSGHDGPRDTGGMMIYRMDHAGVVVEDLAAAIAFFVELGLELEGEAAVEGEWVDQLVGLDGVRADIAVVRTPDGHGRVELSTFHTPVATSIAPRAPMNTPGIPRLTFVVDAVDDVLDRLRAHGAELVGEVAQYGDIYRYCYVRGPDGIIIGLVEQLN
jgi:catechol 2,3-dioxygenase-like lactoylglutathione lyase family enzyme